MDGLWLAGGDDAGDLLRNYILPSSTRCSSGLVQTVPVISESRTGGCIIAKTLYLYREKVYLAQMSADVVHQ